MSANDNGKISTKETYSITPALRPSAPASIFLLVDLVKNASNAPMPVLIPATRVNPRAISMFQYLMHPYANVT